MARDVLSEDERTTDLKEGSSLSEPAHTTTMIYPIRSLLSEVLPSSSAQGESRQRTSARSHENSGRQRRTAQWQADMLSSSQLVSPEQTVSHASSSHEKQGENSLGDSSDAAAAVTLPSSESESSYTSYEPQSSPKSLLRPPLDPTDEAYLRVHTGNPLTTQNVNPSMEKRQEDSSNKSSERAERLAAGGFLDIGPARTFSSGGPTTRSATSQGKAPGSLNTSALPSQTRKDRIQHDEHSAEGHPKDEMFDDFPAARRFKHVETEDGHHLILGPEGRLERCEDEPIHAPGAVQAFGVLIALEEDVENATLIVRQVSENSTKILGLSPSYLFRLQCFTDALPPGQAQALWDIVQYLHDPNVTPTATMSEEAAPQVFLLTGFGEPGYTSNDVNTQAGSEPVPFPGHGATRFGDHIPERRQWTCWCAVHRPKTTQPRPDRDREGDSDSFRPREEEHRPRPRSLVILELELERDPLYPLFPIPIPATAIASSTARVSDPTPDDADTLLSTSEATYRVIIDSTLEPPSRHPASSDTVPPVSVSHNSTNATERPFALRDDEFDADEELHLTPERIAASTTNKAHPIRALERLRRLDETATQRAAIRSQRRRGAPADPVGPAQRPGNNSSGTLDAFAVLAQINEQLASVDQLDAFFDVVVGLVKDVTQFHRVLMYRFDESYNGEVVAELVDWTKSHELYRGLYFPAEDIPPQARLLYQINKVRSLYDRELPTARLVGRTRADVDCPLDLTHSYLRAMSPIHLKYLGNMGVRCSMSISIPLSGKLWGLVVCHSYGEEGMRVSFPVRQMLRLLSDSIARNIERLIYARRLHTRKLVTTIPSEAHPTGHIVSDAEDLLELFDADFGILVIGEGAKILGPNEHGQDILIIAEYLRVKQFDKLQITQNINEDFPDIQFHTGPNVIAGVLFVPLSPTGRDFIAFLRKGQAHKVTWAGRRGPSKSLEPRTSFKAWSENFPSKSRAWEDDQIDTAGILALVYGKFIDVWRQKETAVRATQLTSLLLSNASHEVRTPLNHIINYLELALNGPLDPETRENLRMSHAASKNLLFTINDLLDLTRLEGGTGTSVQETFNLPAAIRDATQIFRTEAERRDLKFSVNTLNSPASVIGDVKKFHTVVANITANAVKYTDTGSIAIEAREFVDSQPRDSSGPQVLVEVVIADTGRGIESAQLERMFREFEQVEHLPLTTDELSTGVGLGLAKVAHTIQQLGGQLRVDSKPGEGSRFTLLLPFNSPPSSQAGLLETTAHSRRTLSFASADQRSEIDDFIEAMSMDSRAIRSRDAAPEPVSELLSSDYPLTLQSDSDEQIPQEDDITPIQQPPEPTNIVQSPPSPAEEVFHQPSDVAVPETRPRTPRRTSKRTPVAPEAERMRILIVEDEYVNRSVLEKRLKLRGHEVLTCTNGQEAVDLVESDRGFDCILMDVQMPILGGYDAAERIRSVEKASPLAPAALRRSARLNNNGIPIIVVSASLQESQREFMLQKGVDGWILKPIDFERLSVVKLGVLNRNQRLRDLYHPGCSWESGGWLREGVSVSTTPDP